DHAHGDTHAEYRGDFRRAVVFDFIAGTAMKRAKRSAALAIVAVSAFSALLHAQQITFDRLLRAASEPQNWLMHNGSYSSQHYSPLTQITPGNVTSLESKWVLQDEVFGAWQSSPVVVDGIMYVTERPNDVMAVD